MVHSNTMRTLCSFIALVISWLHPLYLNDIPVDKNLHNNNLLLSSLDMKICILKYIKVYIERGGNTLDFLNTRLLPRVGTNFLSVFIAEKGSTKSRCKKVTG